MLTRFEIIHVFCCCCFVCLFVFCSLFVFVLFCFVTILVQNAYLYTKIQNDLQFYFQPKPLPGHIRESSTCSISLCIMVSCNFTYTIKTDIMHPSTVTCDFSTGSVKATANNQLNGVHI